MLLVSIPKTDSPPIAFNDTITIAEDSVVQIDVKLNDIDPNLDPLTISSIVVLPKNGNAIIQSGKIVYTPNQDFNGMDSLRYVICDDTQPVNFCDSAWVFITVTPVNDPPGSGGTAGGIPIINDTVQTIVTNEDTPVTVCFNGTDVDGDSLFVTQLISGPVNGMATGFTGTDSCFTYIPGLNYVGGDTLTLSFCDNRTPPVCVNITVIFDVLPVNDPPGATTVNGKPVNGKISDSLTTPEDVPLNVCMQWMEVEGGTVTATSSLGSPFHGTLQAFADGDSCFTYVPDPDYNGLDTLYIELCDNSTPPVCDTLIIPIVVTPVDDNPKVVNGAGIPISKLTFNINEDSPINVCLNAVDPDNQPLDVNSYSTYTNRGVVMGLANNDTCFTYTPNLNYFGIDSILVYTCDNSVPPNCDSTVVVFNIAPVNDAPYAINDTTVTTENVPVNVQVLLNDKDTVEFAALDTAGVTIVTAPLNGSTIVNANGTIDYIPTNGFAGIDSLEYRVCDKGVPLPGACATAWIFITVDPINDPPVAVNDLITTGQNTPVTIDVTLNDSDPENDNLTVSIITGGGPFNGTIGLIGSSLTYTPGSGFCGVDSVYYRICDDGIPSKCDSAYVIISVVPEDDDEDGLSNLYETLTLNTDGDLLNNYLDIDSDNDGISDSIESIPVQGDICNPLALDTDGDGVPDYMDPDSDNDGIPDWAERSAINVQPTGIDTDGDGVDDAFDPDNGGYLEGIPIDTDGDNIPDFRDTDSDGDAIPDWIEGSSNGIGPLGTDSDGDGIDDAWDRDNGGVGLYDTPVDTDGDGTPDFRDLDTDDDGIVDAIERGPNGNNPVDSDNDGIADFRDIDSDNDGILDINEGTGDCDGDGIPDYLDEDSCQPRAPNGFSPNGDGDNDTYVFDPRLDDPGAFPNNSFIIYNRWGTKVYEKAPYDNSWGGESNVGNTVGKGNKLPVGTYYYVFDYGVGGPKITGYIYLKQ